MCTVVDFKSKQIVFSHIKPKYIVGDSVWIVINKLVCLTIITNITIYSENSIKYNVSAKVDDIPEKDIFLNRAAAIKAQVKFWTSYDKDLWS